MHRGNITQMWWLSTLLALLLLCPAYNTQCSNDVPADCEFNNTDDGFCGWEHHNWTLDHSRNNDWYAYLSNDTLSGYMKSKERCVSSNISHCLRFRFRLDKKNLTYSLNVSISWPANNTQSLLWAYSNQTFWTNATVPVWSASNFTLTISARSLNATHSRDIFVDKLKYKTSSCHIEPSSATPPTTAPPPLTTMTTSAAATTSMMTSRTTPPTKLTLSTITDTMAVTKPSSSQPGTIIGIVLAVIGVVVFGVVVCTVIRRRRIPLMAMLLARKKNHTEDSGYQNPAGENCNEVYTTNFPDNSRPRICSGMSNEDYSVIDDIQTKDVNSSACQPITSLYSKAMVLHSVHREDSKTETSSPDANPYDLIDEKLGVCQARGSSLTVEYNILAIHKTAENLPQPTQTGGVYHVVGPGTQVTESGPTSVDHILEETEKRNATEKKMSSHPDACLSEESKGDYHSLDFQKKMRGGDVAGDSGDEMGQTYSHLNEAGEDTYSELSREKKRKVVDGDYSHVTMD